MKGFDLLAEVKAITRDRGINPSDYLQTLKEANGKRWGASSIIRADGIGIDEVFQEFQAQYPSMFEGLDDFVDALAHRLGRRKTLSDQYDEAEIAEIEEKAEEMVFDLQVKPRLDTLEKKVLMENELIRANGRKIKLTPKAIKKILERSLDE